MNRIAYRNLVGVAYTEEEMKEIAKDTDITEPADKDGNPFTRPGNFFFFFFFFFF